MLLNPEAKHKYSTRGKSTNKSYKPKRKSSGKSSNGKNFADKPKRKSSGKSSKKTVRSSDAKPKKRFYPAKKKTKK